MSCGHEETVSQVGPGSRSRWYATALTARPPRTYPFTPPFQGRGHMVEYPWWEPYKFAVLETNRNKLRDRVNEAEQAIRERASLNGQVSNEERIAIEDAVSALKMLRRESEHDVSRWLPRLPTNPTG